MSNFKVYNASYPHFITNTIIYWIPVFCREDYFRILIDSITYCIQNKGLLIHGYVLMPNHFHAVCSQTDNKFSAVMRDLKRHTASKILLKLEEDERKIWLRAFTNAGADLPRVWEDEYHPEQVHSEEFYHQKMEYMHNNPVKAGYVRNPEDWKYSSAGYYLAGLESVIPITLLE